MSVFAAQQMQALQQEKASRTPAQQKIDSNVLYTLRMLQGQQAAPGIPYLYTGIDLDENGNIVVDIVATVTDQLRQRLGAAGARILYSNATLRSIRAIIPPAQIENIAASPEVVFIGPKQGFATHRATEGTGVPKLLRRPLPAGFEQRAARIKKQMAMLLQSATSGTGQGSVTTEGDATHRASDARSHFGVDGSSLKIGVLSDGVISLAVSQASGDLGPVTVLPGQTGNGDEGTAMLEIIHDMAPGASLFFATADNGITSFAQNIRNLRAAGCDIIVDDVFYFVETPFQDGQAGSVVSTTNGGVVTQAVNDVVASGALYFSSAGNEGSKDDGTSGTFEGDFNGVAFTIPGGGPAGKAHDFGSGTLFDASAGSSPFEADLFWADPLGGSSNDYDLYVLNNTGTAVVASSTNIQNGTQDPFESVPRGSTATGNRFVVFQTTGAANRFFHLGNLRGRLTVNTPGETHGHSAASGAYTVAATPAAATPFGGPAGPFPSPFNAANVVETFNSDGLRRVFFNGDSSPITPGNFSSTGGLVLNKPDITAADGVSVTGVGGFGSPFFGTSAAAPSAAAVAALVKSAKAGLTPAQVRTALTSTAVDIMGAGFDRNSGSGIVMAFEAVNSLGVSPVANPGLGTITATENPGDGDGVIEAGEGGKLIIQLKNTSGVVNATGITATLTTATPGVTVTLPGTSAYPDLAAGGAVGNNLTPFTFTLASNAACGLTIDFTLTLTYSGGPTKALGFSVPTGIVTFNNNLGTLPAGFPGVTTATGTQTGRLNRSGITSSCAAPKANPGLIATTGSRVFDSYTFTACQSTCISSVLTSANGVNIYEAAYTPTFVPATPDTNYLADPGLSSSTQNFTFNVAAATPYTIVVHDISTTPSASAYSLQFPVCAFNCSVNHVPVAVAHNVTVVAATPGGAASANIDNGSSDPDGDPLTITQTPPGPYPVGNTTVLLTATDPKGAAAQASATVTVLSPGSDIAISKRHSGNFSQGQTGAVYTLTVTNFGSAATSGTVTVTDTLPAGLTAMAISGTGWSCTLGTLTCSRSDALASATSYPDITLTVNVVSAAALITNTATVSNAGDVNAANNSASDVTTVTQSDLTISKTHVGNFAQGQTGKTYAITVSNSGIGATGGAVTVTDTLPSGLTATAISGSGWSCTLGSLTCTRNDVLAASSSYPPITLTVNVASNASASLVNTATVSGGGEGNTSNDLASDSTTVTAVNDFTLAFTVPSATVAAGQSATSHITLTPNPSTSSTLNFSCSGLPTLTTCSFTPASVPPGTSSVDVVMTITTTAAVAALPQPRTFYAAWLPLSGLGLMGLVVIGRRKKSKKNGGALVVLTGLALTVMLALLIGCGGGHHTGSPGTPPGTYTITATGTSGSTTHSTTFTLNVN